MQRSLRLPAALLALAALTAGMVEGAAAECVPSGDMTQAATAHHAHAHQAADPATGADPERPGHHAPERGEAPACPTGMSGAGGACGLVLLAGAAPAPAAADAALYLTVPALAEADGRLAPSGPFRPPRV
jgi:hypothetical protein